MKRHEIGTPGGIHPIEANANLLGQSRPRGEINVRDETRIESQIPGGLR
jgi:hypothetical protein